MKKFLLTICLALLACEHKEEPKVEKPAPCPEAPACPPVSTNPFEKPAPAPPAPAHEPFKAPKWEMFPDPFNMNTNWQIFTWRDVANHNTCYFYNVENDAGGVIGHGISCVKE